MVARRLHEEQNEPLRPLLLDRLLTSSTSPRDASQTAGSNIPGP
jgi:hypothetical protein